MAWNKDNRTAVFCSIHEKEQNFGGMVEEEVISFIEGREENNRKKKKNDKKIVELGKWAKLF